MSRARPRHAPISAAVADAYAYVDADADADADGTSAHYECGYGSCPRRLKSLAERAEHRNRAHDASETGADDAACDQCTQRHKTHVSVPLPLPRTDEEFAALSTPRYICRLCCCFYIDEPTVPQFFFDRMIDNTVWLQPYSVFSNRRFATRDGKEVQPDRLWACLKPVVRAGVASYRICACIGEEDRKWHKDRKPEAPRERAIRGALELVAERYGWEAGVELYVMRVCFDAYTPAPGEAYLDGPYARMSVYLRVLSGVFEADALDDAALARSDGIVRYYTGYPENSPRIDGSGNFKVYNA